MVKKILSTGDKMFKKILYWLSATIGCLSFLSFILAFILFDVIAEINWDNFSLIANLIVLGFLVLSVIFFFIAIRLRNQIAVKNLQKKLHQPRVIACPHPQKDKFLDIEVEKPLENE